MEKFEKVVIAEQIIGKNIEDFTADDFAALASNEHRFLEDYLFVYYVVEHTKDDVVRDLFYPSVCAQQMFSSLNKISYKIDETTSKLKCKDYTEMIQRKEKTSAEELELLSFLAETAKGELTSVNVYEKLAAYIQLNAIFGLDITENVDDIKNTLILLYREMARINPVAGYNLLIQMLNYFIEPLDVIFTHYNVTDVIDENNPDYSSVMTKLKMIVEDLTKQRQEESVEA